MKVIIDDVQYVPIPDMPEGKNANAALELRFDSDAGKNITIRDYLYTLLYKVWDEQEGFNGKRPFGNSSWSYDMYVPLIKAGYIKGTLDEDGYAESFDKAEAWEFVEGLIKTMCYGSK